MEIQSISGYYTVRIFIDKPLPVNDFNGIKFFEAELFLLEYPFGILPKGNIRGALSPNATPGGEEKQFMDITGTMKKEGLTIKLEFEAKGRPNTPISEYLYNYSGFQADTWEKGDKQRLCLTGTVIGLQDHRTGDQIYPAGITASFIAVKRDFVEPRDIPGIALIPSALNHLSSKSHRLMHMVFHTLRGVWHEPKIIEHRSQIAELGWELKRPPFTADNILDVNNGAGEDFLFMHRKMISMVKRNYEKEKIPYIESWKAIPGSGSPQFFYSERDDPAAPGMKKYYLDIQKSGNMIPPSYTSANFSSSEALIFLKSYNYFAGVMSQLERVFKNKNYLSSLSLGALGNMLEFVIHNQMHMRWSSVSRDPISGEPMERKDYDFNEKWDNAKYDYLGDFYSSHVNPLFWRLHGWIDDRIEDWYSAHESTEPGVIERYENKGVPWYKPCKWVQVEGEDLFYWPEEIHQPGHEQIATEKMLKVLKIVEDALSDEQLRTAFSANTVRRGTAISTFMNAIERGLG